VSDFSNLKKTPLFDEHVQLGAKMVGFGGWNMPVQYSSIMEEHTAVRSAVGVFDISHMGEVFVSGPKALEWLQRVLANNLSKLEIGQCQYTFLLNEQGGVIDDLIAYRIEAGKYLLVINASKIEEDVAWLSKHLEAGVEMENRSEAYAGLAIQGPKSAELFAKVYPEATLPPRSHVGTIRLGNTEGYVARTGYTGEDGFELFFPKEEAPLVLKQLLAEGAKPCGLGARDTLRLEACYPLNGSDLSPEHTPLEAGLGFFVDLNKPDFIGRSALLEQKQSGLKRRLAAFKMVGKTPPPRPHYAIYKNGEQIGEVGSGTQSPTLGTGIGMAYLPAACAQTGETIEIDIRGRKFPATIEKRPLLKK
jgi:aminomethyltransferase